MRWLLTYFKAYPPIVHFLIMGTTIISLTSSMSIVFLPIYLMNFAQIGPIAIGLIVGAGAISATIGGFLGGALSDFMGRNRLMLISLIALGALFIGFVITNNVVLLFVINTLRGLFSAFFLTISKALMADVTPKEKRVRVFSNRYLAGNIGFSIGPIFGSFFGIAGNMNAFILTAFIYFCYFLLMGGLILFTNVNREEEEIPEKVSISQAWTLFRKDRALLLFIIGSVLLTTVHGEMSVTMSQYLKLNISDGVRLFGYLMSLNGITVILTQVMITRWSERFGLLTRIALGSMLFTIGEIGFAFSSGWSGLILSMIVFTFGEILIIPSEYAQIDEITPHGMRGMYYGAQGFSEIGNFIGPWFGSILLVSFGGKTMFLTFALLPIVSIVFYAWGRKLHLRKKPLTNVNHIKGVTI
ncbi:MDR family MFS transporter [Neobacillus sp. K501]